MLLADIPIPPSRKTCPATDGRNLRMSMKTRDCSRLATGQDCLEGETGQVVISFLAKTQ